MNTKTICFRHTCEWGKMWLILMHTGSDKTFVFSFGKPIPIQEEEMVGG